MARKKYSFIVFLQTTCTAGLCQGFLVLWAGRVSAEFTRPDSISVQLLLIKHQLISFLCEVESLCKVCKRHETSFSCRWNLISGSGLRVYKQPLLHSPQLCHDEITMLGYYALCMLMIHREGQPINVSQKELQQVGQVTVR